MPLPQSYARKIGGRKIYAQDVNELQSGTEFLSGLPNIASRQIGQIIVNPGATSSVTFGMSSPSVEGAGANADSDNGPGIKYPSGAVSGNSAGWNINPPVARRDWEPDLTVRFALPVTITTARYWVGLFASNPMAAALPAIHLAGFRFDTAVDGAEWRAVTNDGTTPTEIATGVAAVASTAYLFRIKLGLADVKFFSNNDQVAVSTTTLPTLTTQLGLWVKVATLTTAAREIVIGRIGLGFK